ncbi:TauD/TfdA dioxygenase family protein [Phenylobacterium montanum]|uniref:TauD/TfdA dioxygenase family protein n=1 Tax=Phenylobacterium montanum TaxID=2823693 RepID=UPI0020136927|nr:TauD/TfdA family dioxygenase [Caulobacter sp. S6]
MAEAGANDDLAGAIEDLLLKHKVLFFRDQDMNDAQHAAVARRFGELEDHPLTTSVNGEPGIIRIWKSPESPPERYENSWHNDATWRECPPMGAVLRCIECPPVGGDTMWANMELAFERLPDRVKEDIIDLRARHSMESTFMAAKPIQDQLAMKERFPDPEHPVVRTHPVTKAKALFVNAFTTHFTNFLTASRVRYGQDYTDGSGELLRYLISQAQIPEYQLRWRWTPGAVAIWDNRCTQHYAVMDYPPCVRRMNRATIMGDRPF